MKKALALILTLIMVLGLMPAAMAATAPVEGEVTITKSLDSATPDANGNYTIKLTVQGNPVTQSAKPNADVVLVVDNSGSMASSVGDPCNTPKDKFETAGLLGLLKKCPTCHALYSIFYVPDVCTGQKGKTVRINAARDVGKTFAQNILSVSGNEMAVIGFAGSDGGADESDAIKVSTGLTADRNVIESGIDKMSADGGTNYTAALQRAYGILNGRQDKNRPGYVIFISDGAPGYSGESPNDEKWNGQNQVAALKNDGITIYTIGIALDANSDAYNYLKNMASKNEDDHFENVSGKNYKDQLSEILNNWASDINTVPAGTNAVMTDVINTDKFDYVEDSASTELTVSQDKTTLTWNIGDIPEEVKEVTFKVKPKAGWTGTENTNASCTLTYTKPNNTEGSATAPSPTVTIAATTGEIVVTKNVVMPVGDNTIVNGREYSFTITNAEGRDIDTKTVTIGDNNTGSVTFENVPFGSYTVTENDAGMQGYAVTTTSYPANREVTVSDTANGNITFTNTYTLETVNITVTKVWDDDGYEGSRPSSVTVKLLADGQAVEGKTLTLDATATTGGAQWTGTFMDLPKYNAEGKEIEYTVQEDPVPEGYNSEVTGTVADGFTITNTYKEPGKISINVQKEWAMKGLDNIAKPNEVTIKLFKGNEDTGKTLTLNQSNQWKGTFANLDVVENVTYSIEEEVVEGYTSEISSNTTGDGFTVKNTLITYPVQIKKEASGLSDGTTYPNVTVDIKQGDKVIKTITGLVPNGNAQTVELPAGEYTVEEQEDTAKVEGYNLNVTNAKLKVTAPVVAARSTAPDAVETVATATVKNIYTKMEDNTGSLIVKKTVSGGGASYNKEFTFTVTLTEDNDPQNGEVTYGGVTFTDGVATFTLKHNQEKSITGIPAGYTYTVTENADGYTQSITSGSATGTIEKGKTATVTFNNYKSGGGHYYPTPDPVPPIVIPPKTGDMTIWQSILHFLGIR